MHIGDLFDNRGIELVSISNDTVTFRSAQQFHPGGRVSFELDGQTVKLLVEEASPDVDGNLFSGRAVVGKEILEDHFPQMHSYQQKRRAPRVLHRMKIVSEKLPSFQALSLDFSPLGLRVRLDGAIEENQTIPLLIDFDWPGQEALNTSARANFCTWSQACSNSNSRVSSDPQLFSLSAVPPKRPANRFPNSFTLFPFLGPGLDKIHTAHRTFAGSLFGIVFVFFVV